MSKEPSLIPPEKEEMPRCPVCMAETDTYIRGYWGDIIGCDECTERVDAWDYKREHE